MSPSHYRRILAVGMLVLLPGLAQAASVAKVYNYFAIGGTTLQEIEAELKRRGPKLDGGSARHPGATRMEFTTRVTYGERNGRCSVVDATVRVKATVILPRWTRRSRSDRDTRLIWDTLAADIKRHEEAHVVIARSHAREMEQALKAIRNVRGCEAAKQQVNQATARALAAHDREQDRFDRVETINFDRRISSLLRYRVERMQR